ncbi:hypothetical protein BKA61DRAFT_656033, partial [Leptodontidium sp. MPI-SDFR-AT-0119]
MSPSSFRAGNWDAAESPLFPLQAMHSLSMLEPSCVVQFVQIVAVAAASIFLLSFASSLAFGKSSPSKYSALSTNTYVFLSCQTLLCGFTIFRMSQAYAIPTGASPPWATLSNFMLLSEIIGSVTSLAHFLKSRPQTQRILYISIMLCCETVAAFTVKDFWQSAFSAALYFFLCAAELSLPVSIRLRERSAIEEAPFFARVNFSWLADLFDG